MKIERRRPAGIDRRVARTRALLQDAMVALLAERRYDAITVEVICRRADVGRSTFYMHYPGKDALREATIDAHLAALGQGEAACGPFRFSRAFLEHAESFRAHRGSLFDCDDGAARAAVGERIAAEVRREVASLGFADPAASAATAFMTGAFLGFLGWWLDAGRSSPADADALFRALAERGLAALADPPATARD